MNAREKIMRSVLLSVVLQVIVVALVFNLVGCSILKNAFKPKYDPIGYQYAITLKTEAGELMEKAGKNEHYAPHAQEVYQLMSKVEEAYEHARRQKKNDNVTGTWNVLRNPGGNRLGKMMADWKTYDIMDPTVVATYIKWVNADFDAIIKWEKAKKGGS